MPASWPQNCNLFCFLKQEKENNKNRNPRLEKTRHSHSAGVCFEETRRLLPEGLLRCVLMAPGAAREADKEPSGPGGTPGSGIST